jgi:hypothetical protein
MEISYKIFYVSLQETSWEQDNDDQNLSGIFQRVKY